jgi:hypothetical protein
VFVLEYAQLYIVQEARTENRTHQTTRWKQLAICESREPLDAYVKQQKDPSRYRVEPDAQAVQS